MSWTTLRLQVRTPLFGGDDPASDEGSPVRVPSIRGALRFWFRAVAAGHGVSELGALWKDEQEVFGSTHRPSAIGLRVSGHPTASGRRGKPSWATTEKGGFDGAQYLLGQGLWSYNTGLQRGYVEPGESFELGIRFSRDKDRGDQVNARFMLALWAWLTYGGLGARTRRGFGQLVCTAVDGDLSGGWTRTHLLPPADVAGWAELGECALPGSLPDRTALGWGELLTAPPPADESHPELPMLAPRWWGGAVLEKRAASLGEALHLAGLHWRRFRSADDNDRGRKPSQSTRSPEWTKVIHGDDDRYPIAAFGLPVGYFSRSQGKDYKATVTPQLGTEPLRRASPVWLRPVPLAGGRWGVFTHLFYARLLPHDAQLQVDGDKKATLPVPSDDVVEESWDRWLGGEARLPDGYFPGS
ncbi:MAG: type III-B CRISPR module RAMP protein Cmr1 [Pseudonocardiaceae bacterium]